ncbi:MAG: hypothetical protein HY257_09785 [Chloroflexi bacterium]|nr:hypothetical protein [Chloroflexota bacterium]
MGASLEGLERGLALTAGLTFAVNLYFLFRLARFYELKSGKRVHARLYLPVAALFGLAGAQVALFAHSLSTDVLGDLILFIGGSGALALNYFVVTALTRRNP